MFTYMFITVTLNYLNSVVKQQICFYISAIYFSLCDLLLTFLLMFTPGLFVSALCCQLLLLTRLEVQQISQYTTVIIVVK